LRVQKLTLSSIKGQANALIARHGLLEDSQYQGVILNLSSQVAAVRRPKSMNCRLVERLRLNVLVKMLKRGSPS